MNPNADLDTETTHPVTHRRSGPQCAGRASEHREKAISGCVHFSSAKPFELRADDAVVICKQLLPGRVPEPAGSSGGIHDVGHEESGNDAFVPARHADRSHIAEDVQDDDRVIPDDPGIVSGRDVEDIAWPELGHLAVVHLYLEATGQQDLEMVDLA